ncbi:MAG: DUF2116 family Zn-ribbon domain-containing protein [Saprospiraceae bacterium]
MLHTTTTQCLICGSPIIGRRDKRFCTDSCRSIYHQEHKKLDPPAIKFINSKLRKNRQILASLNPEGKRTLPKESLSRTGFDFNYCTHRFVSRKGIQYSFCYDQGYAFFDDHMVLLVRQEIQVH